jgi:hypothetical protein
VQGLSPNTLEARRALYDKARAALLKQLRSADPALTDSQITKERLLLEDAIRRIETDMLRPETATRVLGQDRAKAALPAAGTGREGDATRQWQGTDPDDPDGSEPADEEPEAEAHPGPAGRFGAAGSEARGFERQRPAAPRRSTTSDGRALRYILMAAGVVVLLGGAAFAVVMMENREDTAALQPAAPERPAVEPAPPAPAPAPAAGKLTDRLGSEEPKPPEDKGAPAQTAAPPEPEQQQAALPPASATPAPAPAPPPTAAQPLTPSPGAEATIVAQNAVLYEEQPDAPQRGQAFRGSVTWRTESVSTGSNAPLETAVKGEVDIPERKIKATVTIRKNVDPALPATHTLEIQFQVPSDFPNGGISNVPGVLMKQSAQQRGVPLQGLSVKVTNGFFLVGLADSPTDQGRNAQLLKERGWIDVPVLYDNGRRAIMTLEKGVPGDRVFADAFAAWGSAPTAQQ